MENTLSDSIYKFLITRNLAPEIRNASGTIQDPSEANIFSFDWIGPSGKNYGTAVILLTPASGVELYVADNIGKTMNPKDKDAWFGTAARTGFVNDLKNLVIRKDTSKNFSYFNLNRLKYAMANMSSSAKNSLYESFVGNKRNSFSSGPNQTRLIIKHNRDILEGEARYRAIGDIFIENSLGERFKVPSRNLTHARILQRHVAEGGSPYDLFGTQINTMMNEIATLGRFLRATRDRSLDHPTKKLFDEAVKHYKDLKNKAKKMISTRGYLESRDAFDPVKIEAHESTVDDIREMFIEKHIDQRVESALPILSRLRQKYMPEVAEFESWTNAIVEGTWSFPETPEQLNALKLILSKPLPVGPDAINSTEQLNNLFGDDELFFQLEQLASNDPDADARPLIQKRLADFGIDIEIQDNDIIDKDVEEDLDVDGVMMTRPSNMSSESLSFELENLRRLLKS